MYDPNQVTKSLHPSVSEDARAVMHARVWLDENGRGGAYSGSATQVKEAMDRYYPEGFDAFKERVSVWAAEVFGEVA